MPAEVLVALLHFLGTILIGALMLTGLFGVLVVWIIPAIWVHPLLSVCLFILILGYLGRR
jgi:hypothetical protein